MPNIWLCKMTKDLCRTYRSGFIQDPELFADVHKYKPYVYSEADSDAYFERNQKLGRIHLAIMLKDEAIGELILKNIDYEERRCAFGICMKNDSYKNKGYGTQAENLMLRYAFNELGMNTVFADALLKNRRSQHVLKKVGFQETHEDNAFRYYRCDRNIWIHEDPGKPTESPDA